MALKGQDKAMSVQSHTVFITKKNFVSFIGWYQGKASHSSTKIKNITANSEKEVHVHACVRNPLQNFINFKRERKNFPTEQCKNDENRIRKKEVFFFFWNTLLDQSL